VRVFRSPRSADTGSMSFVLARRQSEALPDRAKSIKFGHMKSPTASAGSASGPFPQLPRDDSRGASRRDLLEGAALHGTSEV
jgi:hypothetical protein